MPELLAWMIVVGLSVAIAGIFMLAGQIERHTRRTLDFMMHTNDLILSQLERAGAAPLTQTDTGAGITTDRRRGVRRGNSSQMHGLPPDWERRVLPDRRRRTAAQEH